MTRAFLTEDPHPISDEIYAQAGIEVVRSKGALGEDELISRLQDCDILGLRSKTHLTEQVIHACPRLKVVGCYCIGTNQIDIPAATRAGITIFNAPYSNTRSVVELSISHIISLARKIPSKNAFLQRGIWNKSATGAHEVRGKILGIIGYGSIGTQLSVLAEAMGMQVVFFDTTQKLALGNARPLHSMEEVLKVSDFISVHVDGRPSNINLFSSREFDMMREGAVFINMARGFVTDIDALAEALKSGKLSGAAVDVFPTEPKKNGDPFTSPLIGLDNVILTPHIGGSTLEAQFDIGRFVTGKITDYWATGSTEMSVNIPNIVLKQNRDSHYRITLLHRNTPGVLALVNQILAKTGANINGQILGTEGEFGYAITDIASELPPEGVRNIKDLPFSIDLRVLPLQQMSEVN